ncbi:MAG: hypothetical protein MR404_07040 [Prevotellaceae bacterium]|nr:hypothetical protein [Prevotellaceae bacterium]
MTIWDYHLYSAYNVKPKLTVDGKKIFHIQLILSQLNTNTHSICSFVITNPICIPYPCLNSFEHKVYITCVENQENSNPKDPKRNISFTATRF